MTRENGIGHPDCPAETSIGIAGNAAGVAGDVTGVG